MYEKYDTTEKILFNTMRASVVATFPLAAVSLVSFGLASDARVQAYRDAVQLHPAEGFQNIFGVLPFKDNLPSDISTWDALDVSFASLNAVSGLLAVSVAAAALFGTYKAVKTIGNAVLPK